MAANEIHLGDIGTVFKATLMDSNVVVDISTATTLEMIFRKPDQTKVTKTAAFTTDGTDGVIQYTTVADDIDQVGKWKLQVRVVMPTGTWSTDIGSFKVFANL